MIVRDLYSVLIKGKLDPLLHTEICRPIVLAFTPDEAGEIYAACAVAENAYRMLGVFEKKRFAFGDMLEHLLGFFDIVLIAYGICQIDSQYIPRGVIDKR